jgi:catechol 2,3-dioxygenase-like lactoylglutathione lyase family enzyme
MLYCGREIGKANCAGSSPGCGEPVQEPPMIDHVGFPVSDFERAKEFYQQALEPLGYTMMMEFPGMLTDSGAPAAGFGTGEKADFWIGGEGSLEHPVHIAITANDRASVDAFYEAALAAGGKDNGPPGLRTKYHLHYYAAFVLDPEGNNIEAVCHKPA